MKRLLILLLGIVGCYEDPCDNTLLYYEKLPVVAYQSGEPILLGYHEMEQMMGQCECLAQVNLMAKELTKLLEEGDSLTVEMYTLYPPYFECK